MNQRQSSSLYSGISMVWDPQSMKIMTVHEPAAVIVSRCWHLHELRPLSYEHHDDSTQTSSSHHLEILASPW
ncbi:hypothetical protein DPMN_156095 [Dreissena polymorpha]|uniref:Uncharacterized protein n=1 Tax=Dreissena polymorpha TaxID=45954 RepID=A0A9D4FNE4_DREPO|nr:hypothetical protein DPMN_156095 [Dreissena polymorpha]